MTENGPETGSLPEVGRRLMEAAADEGIPLRLLGGVAVWLRATDEARQALGRRYPDIDLVAHERQSREVRRFLEEQGYVGEKHFNAAHGRLRLLYRQPDDGYQIDIFLDVFNMCHKLDLGTRLTTEETTLPAAELLLTKLQIVELNRKDVGDVAMLLWSHTLDDKDGPGHLNVGRVAKLCAADWGLFTTVGDNLLKAPELARELLGERISISEVEPKMEFILHRLDEHPKTLAWKTRAALGRRKRWYELPEEVNR